MPKTTTKRSSEKSAVLALENLFIDAIDAYLLVDRPSVHQRLLDLCEQLLDSSRRVEKSDLAFDTWIMTRDRHYRERHLIGERVDHWSAAKLPEFVAEREKLIYARLKRLVEGPVA